MMRARATDGIRGEAGSAFVMVMSFACSPVIPRCLSRGTGEVVNVSTAVRGCLERCM